VYPSYADEAYRIHFFGDEIEEMKALTPKFSSP
jgi:excinuclease ABC subunit B